MIGVNFLVHKIGTVAVFATLFVAIYVNGEEDGCFFNIERENLEAEYDLQCKNLNNSWKVGEVEKNPVSWNKVALILEPEHEGCFKTKHPVTLDSSSKVMIRYFQDGPMNEKISLRLIPANGSCPDKECLWKIKEDPVNKGKWVTSDARFSLISMKDYYVQLEVDKYNGKFILDSITIPNARSHSKKCEKSAFESKISEINLSDQLVRASGNDSGGGGGGGDDGGNGNKGENGTAPCLSEVSKNLMLTSALVLTLNNLLD